MTFTLNFSHIHYIQGRQEWPKNFPPLEIGIRTAQKNHYCNKYVIYFQIVIFFTDERLSFQIQLNFFRKEPLMQKFIFFYKRFSSQSEKPCIFEKSYIENLVRNRIECFWIILHSKKPSIHSYPALQQAVNKSSMYLSPNYSLKAAWTSQQPIYQMAEIALRE